MYGINKVIIEIGIASRPPRINCSLVLVSWFVLQLPLEQAAPPSPIESSPRRPTLLWHQSISPGHPVRHCVAHVFGRQQLIKEHMRSVAEMVVGCRDYQRPEVLLHHEEERKYIQSPYL